MVINLAEMLPGEFTRNPEFSLPTERIKRTISSLAGATHSHFVNASRLSTALLGQSLGANMFMLGYAYQLGSLPISAEAIEKAIELNGEAVAMNHAAFRWGRRVEAARAAEAARTPGTTGFAETVARYLFKLMAYKDEYEVARLYADPAFLRQVRSEVDGDNLRLTFHLAPPLLARRDKATGEPRKISFGPWMMNVFA